MYIYKANRRIRTFKEIKTLFQRLMSTGIICVIAKYVFDVQWSGIEIAITIALLLLLSDFLTRDYIKEVKIDKDKNLLSLHLKSRIAGERENHYALNTIKANVQDQKGLLKYLGAGKTLLIESKQFVGYSISDDHGFIEETLAEIEKTINQG